MSFGSSCDFLLLMYLEMGTHNAGREMQVRLRVVPEVEEGSGEGQAGNRLRQHLGNIQS